MAGKNPFASGNFDLIGGAVGDVFGGFASLSQATGYEKEAAAYGKAADIANENAGLSKESTALQEVQTQRSLFQALGGQRADIGAAGLAESGSALDVMRNSAAQGALTKQLIGVQGAINERGFEQEATAYLGMKGSAEAAASASKSSGIGSFLGGALKLGAFFLSDLRAKRNLLLVDRREDGIGHYLFQYGNGVDWYYGVVAQEVRSVHPEAVTEDPITGLLMVNYDLLNERCMLVGNV